MIVFIAFVAVNVITEPLTMESLRDVGIESNVLDLDLVKRITRVMAYIFACRLLKVPILLMLMSLTIVYYCVWFLSLQFVIVSTAMLLGWIVTRGIPQNNFK